MIQWCWEFRVELTVIFVAFLIAFEILGER